MEPSPPKEPSPVKKNLENYAISYMGAYLNTVKKERPEHPPLLARNQFYDIEVCLMPNHCFAMLFEKAEKQNVSVKECGWDYVEGKVLSRVNHLVTVYAHEGVTVADAISRGKRDAIRDIRTLEDSDIAKAVVQLEKILKGMSNVEQNSKDTIKAGQQGLAKLGPIKDAIVSAGPDLDMLAMVDALKNYPGAPAAGSTGNTGGTGGMGENDRALLEKLVSELGDLSDVIRRAEAQDQKLEELELAMTKTLSELNTSMDEKVSKGLAAILQASDKKIDKGLTAIQEMVKQANQERLPNDLEVRLTEQERNLSAALMQITALQDKPSPEPELFKDLDAKLQKIEKDLQLMAALVEDKLKAAEKPDKSQVVDELVLAIAEMKDNIARVNNRIIRVEEYLAQITGPKVRKLKEQP